MTNKSPKTYSEKVFRYIYISIGILILGYILWLLKGALLPFAIGSLLAYMLYPLVKFLQHKLRFKSRMLSILGALSICILAITLIIFIAVPPIIKEVNHFVHLFEDYTKQNDIKVSDEINKYIEKADLQDGNLKKIVNAQNLEEAAKELIPYLISIFSGVFSVIFNVFTLFAVLLYFIFILLDFEKLRDNWIKLIPDKYRVFVDEMAEDIEDGMNSYFKAQAKIVFWVGILFAIGFKLINLPLGIGLGIFIGLLNFVPYLQIVGIIPAIFLASVYSFETGTSLGLMIGLVLLVFAVVQVIQEAILTPKIMGNLSGLNPAIILLSLSVWGSLLGMLGMIIAIPLTTILLSYYKRFILGNRKIVQEIPPVNED